jgi:hypothetical protein
MNFDSPGTSNYIARAISFPCLYYISKSSVEKSGEHFQLVLSRTYLER